jgi:hypothetical protein
MGTEIWSSDGERVYQAVVVVDPETGDPLDYSTPWLRSGTGSPEGAVIAPIGTLYTRTDGGAGTTLYVKESGAGNTGWAAK